MEHLKSLVHSLGLNWSYLHWLLGISVAFAFIERLRPARPQQPVLRRGFFLDLAHLLFNGHFYAVCTGAVVGAVAGHVSAGIERAGITPSSEWLRELPFAAQFVIYLLVTDFLQWNVHRLLHRVPLLWKFHQVHHSVLDMDWAGNFRFHWVELVVYKSALYVPMLWFGAEIGPLMAVAVFATAWGHYNHSNFDFGIGKLGYVFNSPQMHLWHHDRSDEGGVSKNYGIVLSLWDHLFGTAYWPRDRGPEQLGIEEQDRMPLDLRQWVWPLLRRR